MDLIYKTTKPYRDISKTYKIDIKKISEIFLDEFDFLSKKNYIIRGEKKEYDNLITDIYNCIDEIAKFIIIDLCKGEVSEEIIISLYVAIVFLSIKLIGQYDNYEGFQYKLDDILKYIILNIDKSSNEKIKEKIKEIEYDILNRTNWLGCKGVNKLYENVKLKIKVSTLKHCVQKILKIDTTGMSIEKMKEIIVNTLKKKHEKKEEKKEQKKPIYIANYITSDEESQLLSDIKKTKKWNTSLERRTLHLGCEYDYTRKNTLIEADPIPDWLEWLRQRVSDSFGMNFDQVITDCP